MLLIYTLFECSMRCIWIIYGEFCWTLPIPFIPSCISIKHVDCCCCCCNYCVKLAKFWPNNAILTRPALELIGLFLLFRGDVSRVSGWADASRDDWARWGIMMPWSRCQGGNGKRTRGGDWHAPRRKAWLTLSSPVTARCMHASLFVEW